MADNLNIKGIESDEPVGSKRLKPRGKRRKPFAIEWRNTRWKWFRDWSVYSRYTTAARRDQAYAVLVKKEGSHGWGPSWEFRKRDG